MKFGDSRDTWLKEVVAIVEATHAEKFYLWKEFSDTSDWQDRRFPMSKVPWEQLNPGYGETIGHVAGRPVHIHVSFARILGRIVLFWELTSEVRDYKLVDPYLKKLLGAFPTYDDGHRRASGDAMNFNNALQAIQQANKAKP